MGLTVARYSLENITQAGLGTHVFLPEFVFMEARQSQIHVYHVFTRHM